MKIGITCDLRAEYLKSGYSEEATAEFDGEETIEAIEHALRRAGHTVHRVGSIFSLVKRLNTGERWDLVFNIAEGLHGVARESHVPALLEAYRIPYTFSDPLALAVTLDKPTAKQIVFSNGIPTPQWSVIDSFSRIDALHPPFPVFLKPVAEGTSKGINESSLIEDENAYVIRAASLLESYNQPVLVESYCTGREFTVGITGTGPVARVVGVLEIEWRRPDASGIYSYLAKEQCEQLIDYRCVDDSAAREAAGRALAIWNILGCRDAGRIDFRMDRHGVVHFLEVNPLPGLHPTHSDLPILWAKRGKAHHELVEEIIDSARVRCSPEDRPVFFDYRISPPESPRESLIPV